MLVFYVFGILLGFATAVLVGLAASVSGSGTGFALLLGTLTYLVLLGALVGIGDQLGRRRLGGRKRERGSAADD